MECKCGGVLLDGKTIKRLSGKNFSIILENIPAFKCTRCDAILITDEITDKIKKLVNRVERDSGEIATGNPSANLFDY